MKRMLVAEKWDEFARQVMPKDASSVQRQEMRRAFYAGADALLFGTIAAFAPESEPTAEDLELMDGIQQELQAFTADVKRGRA